MLHPGCVRVVCTGLDCCVYAPPKERARLQLWLQPASCVAVFARVCHEDDCAHITLHHAVHEPHVCMYVFAGFTRGVRGVSQVALQMDMYSRIVSESLGACTSLLLFLQAFPDCWKCALIRSLILLL